MVTIAQIGCGYWGPNLLRNFVQNRDCEVRYVYDVDDSYSWCFALDWFC